MTEAGVEGAGEKGRGRKRRSQWQDSETSVAKCSSYRLSATKHPLNNSAINSPGKIKTPSAARPLLLNTRLLFVYAFEVTDVHRDANGLRELAAFHLFPFPAQACFASVT